MSGTYKRLGDKLELQIKLGDGAANPTTRVFAVVTDEIENVVYPEFEIPLIGVGRYYSKDKVMTDVEDLTVDYYIRAADGVTESNLYDPNYLSEIFMRDFTGEIIKENIDSKISNSSKPSSSMSVVIEESKAVFVIEESKLIATVKNENTITGVISEC